MIDNFLTAIKRGFIQYSRFSGRATRSEYWYWQLFTFVLSGGAMWMDNVLPQSISLGFLVSTLLYIPSLSVTVRRFHDINRSGFWLVAIMMVNMGSYFYWSQGMGNEFLIPLAGSLSTLFCWCLRKSDPSPNRFGSSPVSPKGFLA